MLQAEKKIEDFDAQALYTLREVARALGSCAQIKAGLNRTLEILSRNHAMARSAILLSHRSASEIQIEACRGLAPEEQEAFLRVEDGIVDRVLETGKPVIAAKAVGDSSSLRPDGTHSISHSHERTFICFPLSLSRETSGALLIETDHDKYRDYAFTLNFLEVIAFMIGQAMRIDSEKRPTSERHPVVVVITPLREEICEGFDFSNLIGSSAPMQRIYEQVAKVARSNATVMVRGESGTGKELIAQAIHYNSPRKAGPFIKVNCAALPDTLIESELFGYEKGAFTGAVAQKKGRFELAEGGTLFLDEIGDLNATTAVKLLRVLQEREFERVGGTHTVKANVRLIVATNKDLEKAIVNGSFREDLFYRLNVFAIFLPPLRERKPDIPLLSDHFLEIFNAAHGKNVRRISTGASDMLISYHWPGNVRELSNTIERAVLICDDQVIHSCHLPRAVQMAEPAETVPDGSLKQSVDTYEKDLIRETLETTRGNRAHAARLLRTTERVVNYKANKYGINCVRFK
jgi:Nif-specific regulatory protein